MVENDEELYNRTIPADGADAFVHYVFGVRRDAVGG